jgi:hypothetical protein
MTLSNSRSTNHHKNSRSTNLHRSSRSSNPKQNYNQSKGSKGGSSSGRERVNNAKSSERFVKHLVSLHPSKLARELENSTTLWIRAWKDHETFDATTLNYLVEILAKIPGSSSLDPPPSNLCKRAVSTLLGKSKLSDDRVLKVTETVQNCTVRLMQFEWDEPREEVCAALTDILLLAEGVLRKQNKDHRQMSQSILKHVEDLERPWRILEKTYKQEDDTMEMNDGEAKYNAWQKGTIGWLSNADFFTPSLLPTMKIPGSKSCGVYESKEDYINTVHRLWVGMTFVDGHSSLSPRCHSRGGKGGVSCQQTLWPISGGSATFRCRTQHCNANAEFACRMKHHDALCGECARVAQTSLRGAPGPKASTHIYDGEIVSFDADGRLHIEALKSRNPPQRDIHWRSTKRLACPSLVAIVKLNSRGTNLKMTDLIYWGELTFHGRPQDEHSRRSNGEIMVNMMSITELDHGSFNPGDSVGVIDCMTFVPEWIPVLHALDKQSEFPLPFNEGKLLNLCQSTPSDITNSVVYNTAADTIDIANVQNAIQDMVNDSFLDPIRAIRQNSRICHDLVTDLTRLVQSATLDRMQFISFIDGLRNPVHLTQGPPGELNCFKIFTYYKLIN